MEEEEDKPMTHMDKRDDSHPPWSHHCRIQRTLVTARRNDEHAGPRC